MNDFRKKRAEIEVSIKQKEEEISKKDNQTSQVSTNEAYKALQEEMNRMREAINGFEDEALKIMEEEEDVNFRIKEQEKAMKAEEEKFNTEIKVIESEMAEKDAEIIQKKKARDGEAENIDRNLYERYERIRINKGGLALAKLIVEKDGSGQCEGCRMSVRPQAVIEVRKKTALHTCENCARIWYIENKEEAVK